MKNLFFYHLFFLYFSFCEDLKKEKNIFILNPDNFDNTLKKYPIALVEFYYIKCIHCKDFEPTFSKIGDLYNNNEEKNKNNIIAKIDDTEYIDFTKKYRVTHYPTLLIFQKGILLCEIKEKTELEIVNHLNNLNKLVLYPFESKNDIENTKKYSQFILLYLGNKENDIEIFKQASNNEFLIKNIIKDKELIKLYGEEGNIILLNNIENTTKKFEGELNLENLNNFIIKEGKNYVKTMDKDIYLKIYLYQISSLYLFVNCEDNKEKCKNEIEIFDKSIRELYNDNDVKNEYLDLIYFIKVDISDKNKEHFTETITKDLKFTDKKTPTIILNYNTKKKIYILKKDFNSENIQNFVKSFFKGELNESDEINDKKEKKVDL